MSMSRLRLALRLALGAILTESQARMFVVASREAEVTRSQLGIVARHPARRLTEHPGLNHRTFSSGANTLTRWFAPTEAVHESATPYACARTRPERGPHHPAHGPAV